VFHRRLTSNDTFLIYRKAFCRVMPVVFSRSGVTDEGFPAFWFRLPDDVFGSPDRNPENECYCRPKVAPCLLSGLADITSCYYSKLTSCNEMRWDFVVVPKDSTLLQTAKWLYMIQRLWLPACFPTYQTTCLLIWQCNISSQEPE
jgi:hypothetical protein